MRQTHTKFRWLEALPSVKSTDCLTFSISSFLFEMVKDEIQNSFGLYCLYNKKVLSSCNSNIVIILLHISSLSF
jgi:hypothetical protein